MQSIGHRTQQPSQPPPQTGEVKVKETEDLRRDFIAGAALSTCKVFARGVMQAIAEKNVKKLEQNELAFLDCVNNYAAVCTSCEHFLHVQRNMRHGVLHLHPMDTFIISIGKLKKYNGIVQKKLKRTL